MMFLGGGFIGDILADRNSGGVFSFHFRSGPELEFFHIRPSIGGLIATNRSAYGWLGLNLDLYFGSRIVATPSTSIGAYNTGDGQDLGGILQFRNGLDIAWRFDDWARLGVGLHYMSNYGIGDRDPGIASVMLFYAHPLGSLIP
ncbi:MAG: acyloxyacyl hydrolase [Alphaproteobacteria bacterium]|nr:acyloxyacyl hydrolase [Alphaproteobacteria bacterium]